MGFDKIHNNNFQVLDNHKHKFSEPVYTVSQTPADKIELSAKANSDVKSNKRSLKFAGIGLGAVALITASALVLKGRIGAAKQVFSEIKFQHSKTIQEAEAYAKNILKLEKVDYADDLDVANWSNEALTNLYNKGKGKITLPVEISCEANGGALATCKPLEKRIVINRDIGTKMDELIKGSVGRQFVFSGEQIIPIKNILSDDYYAGVLSNLKKYLSEPESFDFNSKMDLAMKLDMHNNQLFSKFKNPKAVTREPITTPFDVLYHEIGHYQHYIKDPKKFIKLASGYKNEVTGEKIIPKFWLDPYVQSIAVPISIKSHRHPLEFVADVYKESFNGVVHDSKTMSLYKDLGGVAV